MEGRRGRHGKGDNGCIAANLYTSSQTVTIPKDATRAKVVICSSSNGGWALGCTAGAGAPGIVGQKFLTGLKGGQTLAVTIGAGGATGATAYPGNAGGTTSIASGSQIITTVSMTSTVATAVDINFGNLFYKYAPASGTTGFAGTVYIEWYL